MARRFRSLALKPKIMLFDEVTSALDPELVGEVLRVVRELAHASDMSMLIVTHEMAFAADIADRVLMFYPLARLKPGEPQVLFDGTPDELTRCPDPRVRQFVEGEARDRWNELAKNGS